MFRKPAALLVSVTAFASGCQRQAEFDEANVNGSVVVDDTSYELIPDPSGRAAFLKLTSTDCGERWQQTSVGTSSQSTCTRECIFSGVAEHLPRGVTGVAGVGFSESSEFPAWAAIRDGENLLSESAGSQGSLASMVRGGWEIMFMDPDTHRAKLLLHERPSITVTRSSQPDVECPASSDSKAWLLMAL